MDSIYQSRKYSRVDWHNYDVGLFFVTFTTRDKVHYFGRIENGKMLYSEIGEKMVEDIMNLSVHYSDVEIDEWVVMPNHVHLIIGFGAGDSQTGMVDPINREPLKKGSTRSRLSSIIGNLKSGVKRYANQHSIPFDWNTRFYEHIIRSSQSYRNIKEYIGNNISKWDGNSF